MAAVTTFYYSGGGSSTSSDTVLTTASYSVPSGQTLTSVQIGSGVTRLENGCFFLQTSLTSITIPNNVLTLGDACFRQCTSLTSVTIGSSVTTLGSGCFLGCSALTSVTIPNSVTNIQANCFTASGLTSITIPNSVTSFGDDCFSECTSLTSATIGSGIGYMKGTFYKCTSLASVNFIPGVTPLTIGDSTFYNNYLLTSIIIPDRTISLGATCFYECAILASVQIGKNVASIGYNCFQKCHSLRTLNFQNQNNLTTVYYTNFVTYSPITVTYQLTSNYAALTTASKTFQTYMPAGSTFIYVPAPDSNICFPAGTPITCNQGVIHIDKIDPAIHTIRNNKIVAITKTVTPDKYLVQFEKDALGKNIPSERTTMSKNHALLYKGEMIPAKIFVKTHPENVKKIPYKGVILYNVLMEQYDKMVVNNLICETVHPNNFIAKLYKVLPTLTTEQQIEAIQEFNKGFAKEFNKNKAQRKRNFYLKKNL